MTTLGAGIVQPILDYSIEIPGDRDRRTKGDALLIGADYSPGKATVRKASEPRNWDKRKGYGFSGATVVYTGDDLSEFDVDFYLWTERQQIEWDAFKKKYFERPPRPSTLAEGQIFLPQPKALGMQHPVLAKANITAAVVKDVMFAGADDYGGFLWTVSFIQFRAPFFGLGRPDGTIPAAKKAQPTAKDKTEQEIDRVLEEIRQANDNLSRSTK